MDCGVHREDGGDANNEKANTKGDRLNIILLLFLYTLQNVASGLMHTIPLVMQSRNVSYADQVRAFVPLAKIMPQKYKHSYLPD